MYWVKLQDFHELQEPIIHKSYTQTFSGFFILMQMDKLFYQVFGQINTYFFWINKQGNVLTLFEHHYSNKCRDVSRILPNICEGDFCKYC